MIDETKGGLDWGDDLNILCAADFDFLPGAYGLFNSSICNEYKGNFHLLVDDSSPFDEAFIPDHSQFKIIKYSPLKGNIPIVQRLAAFETLDPGKYLFIDADFIVERPCGQLIAPIDDGLLVSVEPESKYDQNDALNHQILNKMGIQKFKREVPYINGGFLGFCLPRDEEIVETWRHWGSQYLENYQKATESPELFFSQNILWFTIRSSLLPFYTITSRQLEFPSTSGIFFNRPFPWQNQQELRPRDQLKYLIHGTALRRPWSLNKLQPGKGNRIRNLSEKSGLVYLYRNLTHKIYPYERAWAYYTCREDLPIPLSFWADKYGFQNYKNYWWRMAHGL